MTARSPVLTWGAVIIGCWGAQAAAQQLPNMALGQGIAPDMGTAVLQLRTLDEEGLFTTSAFGQRVLQEIDTASRALEQENEQLLAQLTARELELTDARTTMPPADFRAAADAFDQQAELIRRTQAEKRQRLGQFQENEQRRFFALAAPILQNVLVASGAQVVIDARAVILGVEGMDLTREAIAAVNAAIGDGGPPPTPLNVP